MAMSKEERKQVAKIQELLGKATESHYNDRDPEGFAKCSHALDEAFHLCIEILGKYPPLK